jgi:hypothetical protein
MLHFVHLTTTQIASCIFTQAGKRHGTGIMKYRTGDMYEGEWVDDCMHGQGIMVYTNGEKYRGQWEGNKRHGIGVHQFLETSRYEGSFVNDQMEGKGAFYYRNGSIYKVTERKTLHFPAPHRLPHTYLSRTIPMPLREEPKALARSFSSRPGWALSSAPRSPFGSQPPSAMKLIGGAAGGLGGEPAGRRRGAAGRDG